MRTGRVAWSESSVDADPRSLWAVEARGLVKLFGSTPALLRVDLSVRAGTVCALLGGNGAGKTTLLRILATALRPTAGSAAVLGLDVFSQADAVRRAVDLLPAFGGVYPELSAHENLRFATAMRGLSPDEGEIADALATVGLGGRDELVRAFSSGMVRRLAVARLLLVRPQVALLDEPYAGLDDEGRELVDGLILAARAEQRTVLVATHHHERLERVADDVCRLERGVRVDADSWIRHEPLGVLSTERA